MTKSLLFSMLMVLMSTLSWATIVYTDINPDVTTTLGVGGLSMGNIVSIDFDNDGTQEYNFRWDDDGSSGWYMHMTYANGNEFNLKGTATNPFSGRYLQPMNLGDAINSSANWGMSIPEPFIGDNTDPNFQNLGDKYVGVKFFLGSNTHYGWVLVSFSSTKTLTIKGYAYESTPNAAINAGDTGGSTPPPPTTYDIAMDSISIDTIYVKGNIQIKGRIKNIGTTAVDTFDVVYKIDGANPSPAYSVIASQSIATNQTYNFVCNLPWNANIGNHTIEITASNPNGANDINTTNNSMTKAVLILNEKYTKTLVCEEAGGTWCKFCPRGLVGLNTMAHNHPDSLWIGIAVHINGTCHSTYSGEPMVDTTYETGIKTVIQYVPTGAVDRNKDEVLNMTMTSLEKALTDHAQDLPFGKVAATNQTWNGRNFTIDTKSEFALDFSSANYRLALVVLEDDVTGTAIEWAQHDFFQGFSTPMVDWDGFNYNTKGTLVIEGGHYVPAALMHYNHVARQLIGGWNGVANSIPTAITHGTQYSYTFTGSIPADHNPNKTSFVVLLIDNTTGHIVNANKLKSNTSIGIANKQIQRDINIFPNPSNGVFRIENAKGSQISIYNIMGQKVYENFIIESKEILNLSFLNTGNYIIKISNDNSIITKQVSVVR